MRATLESPFEISLRILDLVEPGVTGQDEWAGSRSSRGAGRSAPSSAADLLPGARSLLLDLPRDRALSFTWPTLQNPVSAVRACERAVHCQATRSFALAFPAAQMSMRNGRGKRHTLLTRTLGARSVADLVRYAGSPWNLVRVCGSDASADDETAAHQTDKHVATPVWHVRSPAAAMAPIECRTRVNMHSEADNSLTGRREMLGVTVSRPAPGCRRRASRA